jgi:tetratricopeptide (TPR) repeat protein
MGNAEQSFVSLDRAQALAPHDASLMKAWLDSATALASAAADDISNRRYKEAKRRLLLVERPLAVSPSWHNLIGYAEFKLGNPEPALAHLQRALQMEPDNEDYVLDLGEFLAYYRAHEQAFQIFEVAAKRMSQSPRVQFGLAVALVLQNRRDEATNLLNTLVTAHPDFEPAYRVLGECHEDAGRTEDMVATGRKLQSVNPRNSYGWYLEGRGLLGESRAGDTAVAPAIVALQRAIALDPNFARAHFHLARAYEQMGDSAQAELELKTTIRIEPQHPRAHYVLGMLYQQTDRKELAKTELALHRQLKEQDRQAEYRRLLIVSR